MRPHPARWTIATGAALVPRLERLRGFVELRNRFSRVEVFRRAFRKYVGVAPAVYRQAFTPA